MRIIPCGTTNLIDATLEKEAAVRSENAVKKFAAIPIPENASIEEAYLAIGPELEKAVSEGVVLQSKDFEQLIRQFASKGVKVGDGTEEALLKEAQWMGAAWDTLSGLGKDLWGKFKGNIQTRELQALMGQIDDLRGRIQKLSPALQALNNPTLLEQVSAADAALANISTQMKSNAPSAATTPEELAPQAPAQSKFQQPKGLQGQCPPDTQPTPDGQCSKSGLNPVRPQPKPTPAYVPPSLRPAPAKA